MNESSEKEELSIVYMSALCAAADISFDLQRHDDDSTDAIIKKLIIFDDSRKFESILRVQLKATSSLSQYSENESSIIYKLKIKNYNDLRTKSTTPIILALLILPEDKNEWVKWTEADLLIKARMYWASFETAPENENKNNISVELLKKNYVNKTTLLDMLKRLADEM